MKNRILIVLSLMIFAFNAYSQRSITSQEYEKIITTDAYYYGRSDFDLPLDKAKKQAREELINQISEVEKSINENELIKRANYVKFEVEGNRTRIILYIPKDSLHIEHVVEKTSVKKKSFKNNNTETVQPKDVIKEPTVEKSLEVETEKSVLTISEITTVVTESDTKPVKIESNNEIINTLSQIRNFNDFCIQLNRYKHQGKLFDSQSGVAPDVLENCMMAIFQNEVLEALYDSGSTSRKDFLSGKTIQNPMEYYNNKEEIKVIFIKLY
ncbi:MAG: hypothetical protein FWH18_02490 [Marinilabiliaceae bacterium]|nr:hypothetical protein [Marinilabiliaceae bacterium]